MEVTELDDKRKSYRSRGLKPERAKWGEDVLAGYLECSLVRDYIRDPQAAWDAIVKDPDGGVGYLVRHLTPILTDDLKTNQLAQLALGMGEKINQMLRPFYFGADKDEERAKKEKQAYELIKALTGMMGANQRFGQLLRALQLSDTDCQAIYNSPLPPEEKSEAAPPAPAPTADENSFDLDSLFGSVDESTAKPSGPAGVFTSSHDNDAARRFRRRIELAWQAHLDETASDRRLQSYYLLNTDFFHALTVELAQGARRLKVFDLIESKLREAINYSNSNPDQTIWKQSRLAAAYLSSFINWLGLSPVELDRQARTVSIQGKDVTLFEPPAPPALFPELPDKQEKYDLPYFQDWCRALLRLMLHNVDFADQFYDRKENDRLGGLLSRLSKAER